MVAQRSPETGGLARGAEVVGPPGVQGRIVAGDPGEGVQGVLQAPALAVQIGQMTLDLGALGPVHTTCITPVVAKNPPIKARGEKFGGSK
ncbi:hypothetical protein GCM10023339_36770 [Alloalcanivorax gelatiniphagus]